jgi:hypothetical protein
VGLFLGGLIAVSVAACGGDDSSDLPAFSGTEPGSSPSASVSVTPAPDPVEVVGATLPKKGTELGDEKNQVTVGKTLKGNDKAQIAYLAFWVERARALRVVQVDDAALAKVAVGDAATRVVSSVRELKEKKQHAEGGLTVNIVALKVTGATATITDCLVDRSSNRKANGAAVEAPDFTPIPLTATLEQQGEGWRVRRVANAKASACS